MTSGSLEEEERESGYQPGPGGPGSFVIPGVKHKYATGLQIHHERPSDLKC